MCLQVEAHSDCLTDGNACYRACPPSTRTGPAYSKCWQDCDAQTAACVAQHAKQSNSDAATRQCLSISTDRKAFGTQVDAALQRKKQILAESKATLVKIREDLESSYAWTVGDPGSLREMGTMLALCTKTTADLIEDLGGISTEKVGGVANKIYEGIQDGKSAYDLITKDADGVAVEIVLDAGSQFNPTLKAAKALHDFSENAKAMSELQSNLDESRNEFKLQLDNLNTKINALDDQLKKIQPTSEASKIDDLFQTYQSVRQMCTDNRR